MKIALVSPYDFAYPGGVVRHISCLADQFTRLGHDVRIIAPTSQKINNLGKKFIHIGTPRPIPASGSVARIVVSVTLDDTIREVFEREKFDICHLHEPLLPNLCTSILRMHLSPMVGTFHAAGGRAWYIIFTPLAKWYLDRWFNKLDGRICVSQPARDYVTRYFPGEYAIIPNGIDCHHFNSHVTPLPEFADGKCNILFVGRLEKRKGFDYLWKAFRIVKKELPGTRLIAVGPSTRLHKNYEKRIRRAGVEDVVFTGFADYDVLPHYYKSADIACFPATGRESFGIVLLEAMATGIPIVASNIDGYSAVMTDGVEGIAVPPRDVEKLAEAMIKLLRDENLRRQMGSRGKPRAAQYDWTIVARQVLNFYEATLDRVKHSQATSGQL